jgi:hypothetical protein
MCRHRRLLRSLLVTTDRVQMPMTAATRGEVGRPSELLHKERSRPRQLLYEDHLKWRHRMGAGSVKRCTDGGQLREGIWKASSECCDRCDRCI